MAEIKDSGNRREFTTGAVRDVADGKGRCDLLPLDIIGDMLSAPALKLIGDFIYSGNPDNIKAVIGYFADCLETDIYSLVLEAAMHYEDGCRKYGERNWQRGIPCHCYVDSGVRHYLKWRRGDKDERHDRAFIFNMLGLLWTMSNKPEMNDLPCAEVKE